MWIYLLLNVTEEDLNAISISYPCVIDRVILRLQCVREFYMVVICQAAVIVDLTLGPVIQHLNEYIVEPFFLRYE